MKAVGIICEYNPFHNGHLYHIEEIKKMYPDHIIILVVSGPFTERGDASVLTKWEKTEIALHYHIDLIIELPFIFATGSADLFAQGAITILKELQVEYLIFGSEENNIQKLITLATLQLEEGFDTKVKALVAVGMNYPTSLAKVLKEKTNLEVSSPNDLLGISYIKEINKQNANIIPISIQRTNQYHSKELKEITSATSIRIAMKEKKEFRFAVPDISYSLLHPEIDIEKFFPFLKYKIISEKEYLIHYHEVNFKILPRLKRQIIQANSLDEFIKKVKTKSETYSKIKRICLYILCGLTKEEAIYYKKHPYIRILGFTSKGQLYLNQIKKDLHLPLITNYSNDPDHLLKLDLRVHQIYSMIFPEEIKSQLLEEETKHPPKKG